MLYLCSIHFFNYLRHHLPFTSSYMKTTTKLLLIAIALGLLSSMGCTPVAAQGKKEHWRVSGGWNRWGNNDTTSKTFSLDGKDSLSYKIVSVPSCCDLWKDFNGKIHSCKGLTLHAISQVFWSWQLDQTYVKGKLIKSGKPYWSTGMSQASFVNGAYDYKGKLAQPQYVHIPQMIGDKWIKVN